MAAPQQPCISAPPKGAAFLLQDWWSTTFMVRWLKKQKTNPPNSPNYILLN